MDRAAFKVAVNGSDITAKIADRLERLAVTDNAGLDSDTVELLLDDRDKIIELPRIGAEMEIWLGYYKNDAPVLQWMGLYAIDELETSDRDGTLGIHGKAADMLGSLKAPRDESYHDTTLGELLQTITARHGYQSVIAEQLAATAYAHVDQRAQSDIDLLTGKAGELGAVCKPTGKRLVILPQDQGKTASGQTLQPLLLDAKVEGIYVNARIAGRSNYGSVKAHWKEPEDANKRSASVGAEEPTYTLGEVYPNHDAAVASAAAKLKQLKRGGTELNIDLPGNTDYRAERTLNLLNHRHAGLYVIKESLHQIESGRVFATTVTLREPAGQED